MNWTSYSKMSRVSVLLYSVSLNNKMKLWAFTLLDLVLWRRYSPVKLAHLLQYIRPTIIAAYSILSFTHSFALSCISELFMRRSRKKGQISVSLKMWYTTKNWDFPSSNSTCSRLIFLKLHTRNMYSQYKL